METVYYFLKLHVNIQLSQTKNSIKMKSWDCGRSPKGTVEIEKGQGPPTELWGI